MSAVKGIAIVTGSAQGVGRAIALRLANDGFDIGLNDLSSKHDQLQAVADGIEKIGRRALLVPGDISIEEVVKGMIQDVTEELGGLDVMVSNAGISQLVSFVNTEVDVWDRIMAINARGTFLCYKYAAQQMIKQGRGGRIIGASSVLGKVGLPLLSAYSASKFAIIGLTQTAALELAKHNITVNAYAPGLVGDSLVDDVAPVDSDFLKTLTASLSSGAIKQKGQPEDIASIVSYLASKEAHFMTGECVSSRLEKVSVDGGIMLS